MGFLENNQCAEEKREHSACLGDFSWLANASVLVTGATGLIGSHFVKELGRLSGESGLGLKLVLPVRDIDKARRSLDVQEGCQVVFVPWKIGKSLDKAPHADYVVHLACGTSSAAFLNEPSQSFLSIIDGTQAVLEYARIQKVRSCVFASTMEIYGEVSGKVTESKYGTLDSMIPRNSYPIGKKAAECLCASYNAQYGTPVIIARLAQTFGEGVEYDDKRVFAEFGRCAVEGKDIVLLTDGSKRNPYVSVSDAVDALLILLKCGEAGRAYNVANEETYCSIRDMAHLVASEISQQRISVKMELDDEAAKRFRNSSNLMIDSQALLKLGWMPKDGLKEMFESMIASWRMKGAICENCCR